MINPIGSGALRPFDQDAGVQAITSPFQTNVVPLEPVQEVDLGWNGGFSESPEGERRESVSREQLASSLGASLAAEQSAPGLDPNQTVQGVEQAQEQSQLHGSTEAASRLGRKESPPINLEPGGASQVASLEAARPSRPANRNLAVEALGPTQNEGVGSNYRGRMLSDLLTTAL